MSTLAANKGREFHGAPTAQVEYPMGNNLRIFEGAALLKDSDGTAILATSTALGQFLGFAVGYKDNRTGSVYGGLDGSTTIPVVMEGNVWLTVAPGSNWARADSGVTIYASDDDTFTTSAGTNNIVIGKVVLVPEAVIGASSGLVLVHFEATALRSI